MSSFYREHKNQILVTLLIIIFLSFPLSPLAHIRYFYETHFSSQKAPNFFVDECVGARNGKREHDYEMFYFYDEKQIYVPEKYASYEFWVTGEMINGGEGVLISVNNEPVSNVDLSFPQGNKFFYEDFYLDKRFIATIKLKRGRNTIGIKSGNTNEKLVVYLQDPPEEGEEDIEQARAEIKKLIEDMKNNPKPVPYIESK